MSYDVPMRFTPQELRMLREAVRLYLSASIDKITPPSFRTQVEQERERAVIGVCEPLLERFEYTIRYNETGRRE